MSLICRKDAKEMVFVSENSLNVKNWRIKRYRDNIAVITNHRGRGYSSSLGKKINLETITRIPPSRCCNANYCW